MQRAAQTYGAVAKQTANPRELEADLLLNAAARLQAIHDGWDAKRPELDAALVYNRRLWSIFVTSATSPENPLPRRHQAKRRQPRPLCLQPHDGDHG